MPFRGLITVAFLVVTLVTRMSFVVSEVNIFLRLIVVHTNHLTVPRWIETHLDQENSNRLHRRIIAGLPGCCCLLGGQRSCLERGENGPSLFLLKLETRGPAYQRVCAKLGRLAWQLQLPRTRSKDGRLLSNHGRVIISL